MKSTFKSRASNSASVGRCAERDDSKSFANAVTAQGGSHDRRTTYPSRANAARASIHEAPMVSFLNSAQGSPDGMGNARALAPRPRVRVVQYTASTNKAVPYLKNGDLGCSYLGS